MQLCKGSAGARGTARPGASEHQQLCGDYYSFLILIPMYSEIDDPTFSLAFHRTEDSSVLEVTYCGYLSAGLLCIPPVADAADHRLIRLFPMRSDLLSVCCCCYHFEIGSYSVSHAGQELAI